MIKVIMRNINELCKADGVSLKELAQHCGVGARYFINPRSDMGVQMIQKVADFFEIHPSKLLCAETAHEIHKKRLENEIEALQEELKGYDE